EQDRLPIVSLTARRGPLAPSFVSEPLVVPAGARLRFGIALDESQWPPGVPPIHFAITVTEEGRPWWRLGSPSTSLFEARIDPASTPSERRWSDHEVDLSAHAGRTVRLRFETRLEREAPDLPFLYPVWSDPTVVAPEKGAREGPNVVLISL